MIIIENLILAFKSLKANPLRSSLTLIGMAVGIGAVLYVVVLGDLTQQRIQERLESLGSNVLMIRPGFGRMHGVRTSANVVNLKLSDAKEIQNSSNVISVTVPIYQGSVTTEYQDKNYSTRAIGTVPSFQYVNNDHPIEGRFFNEEEEKRRMRVCILGSTVHEELFETKSPIGESIMVNSKRYTVIGLLGAKGEGWSSPDDQLFIPLTTAQERLFGVDNLSSIYAQMRAAEDFEEALFDIELILRRNHRLRPDQENDFSVRRQDFFLSTIQDTNAEIGNFIILIAFVSLVVGGIGIANVMLVAVTERIREIGVRRAIGAKRIHILIQFLTEAIILGLFGGLLGIIAGAVFNKIKIGGGLILPWDWVGYSFLICAGIGVIAGMYPAFRAANENIIDALRYE